MLARHITSADSVIIPVSALFVREHDALERLHILRGQIDFVRAQLPAAGSHDSTREYREILPRLEESYAKATREYEAVRVQRRLATNAETTRSSTPANAPWDSAVSVVLLLGLTAVIARVVLRARRRFRE